MMSIEILVSIDDDFAEVLEITEDPLNEKSLLEKIQLALSLNPDSISHLQIWKVQFQAYANLKNLADIVDKSKIRVVLKKKQEKSPVPLPLPSPKVPPENKCETCFERPTVQPKTNLEAFGHGSIFPHNQLWDKATVKVCFLNDIPSFWTYKGDTYPVARGKRGHVINELDILRLANNWYNELPPSIPKKEREKVPQFIHETNPSNSDIRIWFQTQGGCRTYVGTQALNVPKGSDEANATMLLNLSGIDSYKEHLVMHEFGHALGLGHEHQRSVFWNNIGKFFRPDVVEQYFGAQYNTDVVPYPDNTPGKRSTYDPKSIMHYWFDPSWLKGEYNTLEKVNDIPTQDNGLTEQEKEILKSIFARKGLAQKISQEDLKFVAKTYYEYLTPESSGTAYHGAPSVSSHSKSECSDDHDSIDGAKAKNSNQILMDKIPKSKRDQEIPQTDLPIVAACFDSVEVYLPKFLDNDGEKRDVITAAAVKGIQVAMIECLTKWISHKPWGATYQAVYDIMTEVNKPNDARKLIKLIK